MKSQLTYLLALCDDYQSFGVPISQRDVEYIIKCWTNQGFPWLASVLPNLDDYLLGQLSGSGSPLVGFPADGDGHPKLFNELWRAIHRDDDPHLSVLCVAAIRQITRSYKKVFEVCADAKVDKALEQFIATDSALTAERTSFSPTLPRTFSTLFGHIARRVGRAESFQFSHGPGAVAEGYDSVERWGFPVVSKRTLRRFGHGAFLPTYGRWKKIRERDLLGRVVAVPKTFDKPRLISIEPAHMMYVQQGVHRELKKMLGAFPATDYRSQAKNQLLARQGSLYGDLATLDLSEASDRVSWELVQHMCAGFPAFIELLDACRTRAVRVGDEPHVLRKFASMGSALTFPIQIMVFTTILVDAGLGCASLDARSFSVYGDDIIVPAEEGQSAIEALERHGLKVNAQKSFTVGPFRESCGADWFRGMDVTPIYVRRTFPTSRYDVDSIVSLLSTSAQLRDKGLLRAALHLERVVASHVTVPRHQALQGLTSESGPEPRRRYNSDLQRSEILVPVVVPRRALARGDGHARLAMGLSLADGGQSFDSDPLRMSHHSRPKSTRLQLRWVPED